MHSWRLLRAGETILQQRGLLPHRPVDAGGDGSSAGGAKPHDHIQARHTRVPRLLHLHAR